MAMIPENNNEWLVDETPINLVQARTQLTQLLVSAGTNGLQGGDYGHGGRTVILLNMTGEMLMKVYPYSSHNHNEWETDMNGEDFQPANAVAIETGGDWELDDLIEGLQWIAKQLKAMRKQT